MLANDTDGDGGTKLIAVGDPARPRHGRGRRRRLSLTYKPNPDYCNEPGAEPTDDFTYTLTGGSEASVAVTVELRQRQPGRRRRHRHRRRGLRREPDRRARQRHRRRRRHEADRLGDPARPRDASSVAGDQLSLTYKPNPDYCNEPGPEPTDDFTYTINGGSEASVAVTVSCANDNPVAVDDTATVAEDSDANPIDVLANDTDRDGGTKQITVGDPARPRDASSVAGDQLSLTYKPNPDYCNEPGPEPTDDFTYTLNGGSEASVAVTVNCAPPSGPAKPVITGTSPNSPANENNPRVKGTLSGGSLSTVRIYKNTNCTGTPAATGTPSRFMGAGISVSVSNNTTTAFRATVVSQAGLVSPCSDPFTYIEDSSAPARPTITDIDPNSPANDNSPVVKGSAEAGSTVRLYANGTCSGSPKATGSAAVFSSPGLTASVGNNTTSAFRVSATDAAGNVSACSNTSTYIEDSKPPQTEITSGPSGETRDRTPTFRFKSNEAGSTFTCMLDGEPLARRGHKRQRAASCTSPLTLPRLSYGRHTFEVEATDRAGNVETTPAKRTFRVVQN